MFVSGYGYLWQNVELPEFAKNRLRISKSFANDETPTAIDSLLLNGVEFFIVDKSQIDNQKRFQRKEIMIESNRFMLLELSPD
jgi:hypothetical protein